MIYDWVKIEDTDIDTLEPNKITEVSAGDRKICMLKKEAQVFAFAATCPHQSARFCDGWLDVQGRLVCPLHKYRFDPANGRNTSGEGYKLRTYPVEIRDGLIYVGLIS